MKNIVTIILARGGSKNIPKKNIIDFCGKPLIAWSIQQAMKVKENSGVWVSSDDKKILSIAKKYGANVIIRPKKLATDYSTSESGWIHAIKKIERVTKMNIDLVVGMQPTSPVREPSDIRKGIRIFQKYRYDSMFSASEIGDFLIWTRNKKNQLIGVNHDIKKRTRRQEFPTQYVENGSFYIFKPEILMKSKKVLSGQIGIIETEFWKSFEIDDVSDIEFCETLMKHYILHNRG